MKYNLHYANQQPEVELVVPSIELNYDLVPLESEEDAFEFLKHWKVKNHETTFPVAVCHYAVLKAEYSTLEPVAYQIFTRTEIGVSVDRLNDEQLDYADKVIECIKRPNIAIFPTFATAVNAKKLFKTYCGFKSKTDESKNEIFVPFVTQSVFYDGSNLYSDIKTHDLPWKLINQ